MTTDADIAVPIRIVRRVCASAAPAFAASAMPKPLQYPWKKTDPMQRITLAPAIEISRVIRGGWQLAGGHGAVDPAAAVEDMVAFADAGITTFDCATSIPASRS